MLVVSIPDSSLADEDTLRDKSVKAARLARTFAIFGVERVYIYKDRSGDYGNDGRLLRLILEYMDTPQYLRKRLYGRMKELRYAGLFPPLKAPHHKPYVSVEEIREGEIREGVTMRKDSQTYVDIGLDRPALLKGKYTHGIGKRVTVMILSRDPLECRLVYEDELKRYWGYRVIRAEGLSSLPTNMFIMVTSKHGRYMKLDEETVQMVRNRKEKTGIMLVFGSPYMDVQEIIRYEGKRINDLTDNIYNFFPEQMVESVRLDEAILGCLSILNYIIRVAGPVGFDPTT
jgi:methyltransferase